MGNRTDFAPEPADEESRRRESRQTSLLFLRNILSGWVGRILMMATTFAVTPVLVHGLGPHLYGLWAVAFTLTGFLTVIDVGVNGALIRFVSIAHAAGEGRKISGYVSTAFVFYLCLGLLVFVVLAIFRQWLVGTLGVPHELQRTAEWVLLGVMVSLLIANLTAVFTQVINSLEAFHITTALNLTTVVLNALGIVFVVRVLGAGIEALVISNIASNILGLVTAFVAAKKMCTSVSINPRWVSLRRLHDIGSLSVAVQVSNIAAAVNFSVDKLILSIFVGLSTVGIYDLGSRLSVLVWSLCWMVASAAFPVQSRLGEASHADLRDFYMRAERVLIMTACALGGGLAVVAPWLVPVWLGAGYSRVVLVTQVLALASAGLALSNVAKVTLWGMKRLTEPTVFEIWRLGTHVIVSALLTWRFGLEGALVGALTAMTLPSAWLLWVVHRRLGVSHVVWLRDAAAGPFVSAILAAGCTWVLVDAIAAHYTGTSTRGSALLLVCLSGSVFSSVYLGLLMRWGGLDLGALGLRQGTMVRSASSRTAHAGLGTESVESRL